MRYTVCPYNCWPINCGLSVTTGNNEITSLSGNKHHDFSRGMLCVKGQSCHEIQDNKHRLLSPLQRSGPKGSNSWKQITWTKALNQTAEKMKQNIDAGHPEANAIYHSHGNIVQRINWKILTPRFANMTKMTLWDGDFPCWYDVGTAQELTGYWGLHDPVQMGEHARGIINWAQDPCASMANMVPYILQVKDRGGIVVTIDPRVTQTAALSDLHIRPRLGSDVFLANAVAHILIKENTFDCEFTKNHSYGFEQYKKHIETFTPSKAAEECEIPVKQIERLAAVYAETKPLCTNLSRGALGKHWNGVQMVRAILCLVPLSGNVGLKGGGAVWGESLDWNLKLNASDQRPQHILYPENNFNAIDNALEKGIVNTLLVVGGNPLSQWPDLNRLRRQLKRLDLVVVFDLFLNHTAREVGDIVLPATSWLEELGLRTSNTHIYVMDKALDPPGECREASQWMLSLAQKLGITDYFPWPDKEACLNDCLDSPACRGATVEKLRSEPGGIAGNIPEVPYSDFVFGSPSGKFEFYSQTADRLGLPPLPTHEEPVEGVRSTPGLAEKYPLLLISARRNSHFHSFHDSHRVNATLQAVEPEPLLWVHPKDAAARGIEDGAYVKMFNDRGSARVRVELTTEVSPGHVSLNDCWPELNVVTPAKAPVSPAVTAALGMGGQPSYQNTLVDLQCEGK
ncbi:MAG: molybdopterin-dependent oxidoreductase [bacterium]|nr:molybdopterin-dependent oxidoreductase [bacterium]